MFIGVWEEIILVKKSSFEGNMRLLRQSMDPACGQT